MPLQNKQKESTREQKNKCIGKSSVWVITFFLFVIFKMSLYTFVTLSFSYMQAFATPLQGGLLGIKKKNV